MKIESWKIDRPIPYARNPREIPQKAVDKVAASIQEFGFRQPIVVDDNGVIVAGHTRLLAAQKLGLKKVPVHVAADLSPEQAKAYRLADNRSAQEAHWDEDMLALELQELSALDFDLDLTGFDLSEVSTYLRGLGAGAGHTDEDEAPDAPDDPVTRLGDVWLCGGHRVLCGDATNADDVTALLAGVTPHLMVTDPPYGVNYDPDWRNHAKRPDGRPYGASAVGKVKNDDMTDWGEAWALFPGTVAYVWHAGNKANIVADSLIANDLQIRAQIIWAKNNIVIGRGDYHPKHEPLWYAVRKGKKGEWNGDRKQSTVWDIDKPMKSETGLSTQKPVECMRRPIVNNSKPGEAIYDPFLGSGTTTPSRKPRDMHTHQPRQPTRVVGFIRSGLRISYPIARLLLRTWIETARATTRAGFGRRQPAGLDIS